MDASHMRQLRRKVKLDIFTCNVMSLPGVLLKDPVVIRLIITFESQVLDTWDTNQQMEALQRNRALGGPRHRRQVLRLMRDTRSLLAGAVACLAAQAGLPRAPAVALTVALRQRAASGDQRGAPDHTQVALLMALLYSVDLSVIHRYSLASRSL